MSIKATTQNETSRVPVSPRPKFYFFSAESNGDSSSAWASGTNTVVNSPAELTLVHLMKKDGRREARVGSMNIRGAKTGVMDKDRIAFLHSAVRPGVFMVEPEADLEPGEYGFIYSLACGGAGGAMTARIDSEQYLCLNNLHVLEPRDDTVDPHAILAVLNSRFATWCLRAMNPEAGEALAEVKKEFVERLPVPSRASWPKLSKLSKAMVELNATGPSVIKDRQQQMLTRQIDEAVAQAFDLTYTELAILEHGQASS